MFVNYSVALPGSRRNQQKRTSGASGLYCKEKYQSLSKLAQETSPS